MTNPVNLPEGVQLLHPYDHPELGAQMRPEPTLAGGFIRSTDLPKLEQHWREGLLSDGAMRAANETWRFEMRVNHRQWITAIEAALGTPSNPQPRYSVEEVRERLTRDDALGALYAYVPEHLGDDDAGPGDHDTPLLRCGIEEAIATAFPQSEQGEDDPITDGPSEGDALSVADQLERVGAQKALADFDDHHDYEAPIEALRQLVAFLQPEQGKPCERCGDSGEEYVEYGRDGSGRATGMYPCSVCQPTPESPDPGEGLAALFEEDVLDEAEAAYKSSPVGGRKALEAAFRAAQEAITNAR